MKNFLGRVYVKFVHDLFLSPGPGTIRPLLSTLSRPREGVRILLFTAAPEPHPDLELADLCILCCNADHPGNRLLLHDLRQAGIM